MDKWRINIAIIEPSTIVYEGITNILMREGDLHYTFFHFDNLEEVSSEIDEENINLILINPKLAADVKVFNGLKKSHPKVSWAAIQYSFFDRETLALFDAIIQITDSPQSLVSIINKLISSNPRWNNQLPREQLTTRETEVLKCLIQGLSNKEVADQMNISIHTVISHRKNIVNKTGIKSQAGLTIYAISNKIIDIEDYRE